jgi:hypothetical protein
MLFDIVNKKAWQVIILLEVMEYMFTTYHQF